MYEWWDLFFTDMTVFGASLGIGAAIIFAVGLGSMGSFVSYQSAMESCRLRSEIGYLRARLAELEKQKP